MLCSRLESFKIPRSLAILRSSVKIVFVDTEVTQGCCPLAGYYRALAVMLVDLSIEDSVRFQKDTVVSLN